MMARCCRIGARVVKVTLDDIVENVEKVAESGWCFFELGREEERAHANVLGRGIVGRVSVTGLCKTDRN